MSAPDPVAAPDEKSEKSEKTEADGVDDRLSWLEARTATAYKHLKPDKFKKAFLSDENTCVALARSMACWALTLVSTEKEHGAPLTLSPAQPPARCLSLCISPFVCA